jgi:hypothetical protein
MTRTPFAETWEYQAHYAVDPAEGIEFPHPHDNGETMIVTQVSIEFFGPTDEGAEDPGPEIRVLARRKTRAGGVDRRGQSWPLFLRYAEKIALCERLGIDLTNPVNARA